MTAPATPTVRPRKRLVKRAPPDRSQAMRRTVQFVFLALNLWIGIEFYAFVRYYETGGRTGFAVRPPGVEGWLPIASLMNLKVLLLTGQIPAIHAAGLFLLISFLAISWIFRKAFCGWLCPVGTISEYLWHVGRYVFGRNFRLPRPLDIALRSLKYILFGLFLYVVVSMPVPALRDFLARPYGLIADVKMLNFFRFVGATGSIVMAILVLASIFVQNLWCRYLCSYGALMGLMSSLSPLRIRRNPDLCIDCGKCTRECPSSLPVDQLISIRSAECTACLTCIASCPAADALVLSTPRRTTVPAWALAAGITVLFLGICGYARWTGHWHSNIGSDVYVELIPHAGEYSH